MQNVVDLGTPVPCPPFVYGVYVGPGLTWQISDFGDQNVQVIDGVRYYVLGRTKTPDYDDIAAWAEYFLNAYFFQSRSDGGWAPHRSAVVDWGDSTRGVCMQYYYKASDNGDYDLHFYPALSSPIDLRQALALMRSLFRVYKAKVTAMRRMMAFQFRTTRQRVLFNNWVDQAWEQEERKFYEICLAYNDSTERWLSLPWNRDAIFLDIQMLLRVCDDDDEEDTTQEL